MKTILKFFILMTLLLPACSGGDSDVSTQTDNESNDTTIVDNNTNDTTDDSNTTNEESTIVTFAVGRFEQGLYQNRIEAFEQANPDITIELVSIDEIIGDSEAVFQGYSDENVIDLVKSADVIALNPTRSMIEQELILNLDPLMSGDNQFNADDFYPQVLARYQQNGGTWALPLTVGYGVMVFDKNKFDEGGVAYPEPGWTWSDFLAKAQALTNNDGDTVQWGFDTSYSSPLELIEAKAQRPLIDTTTQPATVNLEHPDVVAAFQWYVDLGHLHEVMPTEDSFDNETVAIDGSSDRNVAIWLETTDFMNEERLEAENLGIVPYPVSSADDNTSPLSTSFGLGNAFVISSGSAKTDAAWTWLKFLSQQASEEFFFASASLPARQSTAEASGFWNDMSDVFADPMRYATEHAFSPTQIEFDSPLASLPFQIMAEPEDIQSLLATTKSTLEESLKEEADTLAQATPVPDFEVAEPPSEQIPEGATVIRFVMSGLPESYRELAQLFQEANPDIVIKIEEPNYFSGDFSMAGLIGEADCFQSFGSLDNPEDLQAVLSIQPFIDSDPEMSEADFYPTVLGAFQKQGQLMGLPSEVYVRVLAYDKRMFDAAGQPYPNPDWTIDEFLETAVALTQGSGADKIYGFKPSTFEQTDLLYMMSQLGAQFIDDSTDPVQTTFTHPDTISAMRWYANLSTEYEVRPAPQDLFSGAFEFDPDASNKAAIWSDDSFGGAVMFSGFGEEEETDTSHIGYVPYPSNIGGAGYESATGLYISAKTEQRQACWEWIKYLSQQPSLAQSGIPAHIGAAESDVYTQLVGTDKANIYRTILQNSEQSSELNRFTSGASWLSITSLWLDQAHLNIVNEGLSVEEALQEAQSKAEAYRACVIQQEALTDPEKQFECVQEVDPSFGFGP